MNDKKSKEKDYYQFSTSLPHKVVRLLKLHAFKDDTTMSEIIIRYQNAYLEKIEKEKAERKAKKAE
jgi:hypothetical protein